MTFWTFSEISWRFKYLSYTNQISWLFKGFLGTYETLSNINNLLDKDKLILLSIT